MSCIVHSEEYAYEVERKKERKEEGRKERRSIIVCGN